MALFDGVSRDTLTKWLTDAQSAYNELATGRKPQVVLYSQGDGQKSVTFTKTSMPELAAYIQQLQAALGIGRRRALFPRF